MAIIPIQLGITKAFLVKEVGSILVDTGCPGDQQRIVAALQQQSIAPGELRLILHTHGHYDHCGSTYELKQITAAPVAIHRQDTRLIEKGTCASLRPIAYGARLVRLISYRCFAPVKPDVIIDHEMDLHPYGVRGRTLSTPGHTAGSISVLLEGGHAIVGDLMMGGFLGGFLFPQRPGFHYFADDVATVRKSIKKLMDAGVTTVHVAHGGPLTRQAILDRF